MLRARPKAGIAATATFVLLLIVPALIAAAPDRPAEQQRMSRSATSADKAVEEIIRVLKLEARRVKNELLIPPEEPDFAQRSSLTADPDAIGRAILTTQHQDILIDAYVRWQLTSFDASLPDLDDRAFARALQSLPALLESPRAQGEVVALFERAEGASRLTERDRQRLEEMGKVLEQRSAIVEPFNRPANGLRSWLIDQIGESGVRSHMVRVEWCAATILGGWSTRSIKTEITKAMTRAASDESLSRPDRQRIAGTLGELAGRSRRFVSEIGFLADGSVEVQFSTAQVTAQDVKRWSDRLFGLADASSTR